MISLCIVGDLMLGDSEKCIGFGTRSLIEKFGHNYPFDKIQDKLKADIVFGNLECVLSDYGYDPFKLSSAQMRATPSSINGLKNIFNVLNIANNHIMQHGDHCFNETVENLLHNTIGVVGIKGKGNLSSQPYIKTVKGIDIGFLGYAFETDKYCDNPLYAQGKEESIIDDIKIIKREVDVVIVSCHWGDEFITRPPVNVINLSEKIIKSGASLIIGHHPHVIQPVARCNSGLIAYSLGNFVSDMAWDKRLQTGLVLKIRIGRSRADIDQAFLVKNNKLSQVVMMNDITLKVENCFDQKKINFASYKKQYLSDVKRLIRLNRIKMYLYFFKNYRKLRKGIFLQIIKKRFPMFQLKFLS